MTREEALNILYNASVYHPDYLDAFDMAIKALEQEPCEDKEYEKNLNELKEQISKEGNTLISKQDLLERFVEIDNEYKNSHWNLLQILANIDILIGKEPCEDAVSRQAVNEIINDIRDCISVEGYCAILERLKKLPSVKPTQNISIQITEREKYGRFN